MALYSHPKKLLALHAERIAVFDHEDALFAKIAQFHDLGKMSDDFQAYLEGRVAKAMPHAFISGVWFLFHYEQELDAKALLFGLSAICHHHVRLKSVSALLDDLSGAENLKRLNYQMTHICTKPEAVALLDLKPFDIKKIERKVFAFEDLSFDMADYVRQKELFSKLIFADKYEAIFNETPKAAGNDYALAELEAYKNTNGLHEPYRQKARDEILEAYDKKPNERIYFITAPTGVGKTLVSLELALKIKVHQRKERIVYAIPFTSIIDQTAYIFEQIFPNRITKHHHKVDFKRSDEEDGNNSYDRMKFVVESWHEPFVVSTFYQLFFTLFGNGNGDNVKFQSLRHSVIVLDEVQAIPFPLWKVLREFFDVLARGMDITFVLMSATMPRISNTGVELANSMRLFANNNRYKLAFLDLCRADEDEKRQALALQIVEEYRQGKSVLCVVNTIKNAKLLFKLVEQILGEDVYCLNSYMLSGDREAVIASLKEGHSSCVKNKILISTQVIEAGVDLDFDIGFRELAPLSSIIQSAGRVNREGRLDEAWVRVFDTLGYGIYDNTLIRETKRHLVEKLAQGPVCERDILGIVSDYFQALSVCLGDSQKIGQKMEKLDFDGINQELLKLFATEGEHVTSVVLGKDLKSMETDYFCQVTVLDKWELKAFRERQLRALAPFIVNVKKKDLRECGLKVPHSDIFGMNYLNETEGFYSHETGFLIKEEEPNPFT